MPIITEAQLREKIRQPQTGMSIRLPENAQFSPSALDFINQWKIEVITDAPDTAAKSGPAPDLQEQAPTWDKPGEFPVSFVGDIPRCIVCGMTVDPKPAGMTQLDAHHYAPKNTPRIRFRGKIDTLHAMFLLTASQAKSSNLPDLAKCLDTLAAYCREMASAEYHQREVQSLVLEGLTADELHQATHDPETHIGIPHLVPSSDDHEILLRLNLLRCQVRETEIIALDALAPLGEVLDDPSLLRAINRLSNVVYYLELLFAAGKIN
jgi:ethanolamine utilization cobalamin adenosyltransferase